MRLTLTYDPALSVPNSWRLDSGNSVRARVRVASAAEYLLTIELRRSAVTQRYDSRHFVRCVDGDTWLISSAQLHEDLPRLELALRGGGEWVHEGLRAIP